MKIALYGASGMVGSCIGAESVGRGHRVTGITRTIGATVPFGVTPRAGNASDGGDVARVAAEHDVVVSALSPPRDGSRPDGYLEAVRTLADNVATRRLLIVGGSGSLQIAPGLRLMDTPEFPRDQLPEARAQVAALDVLRNAGGLVDWVYVSPPPTMRPGERTGRYVVGVDSPVGDVISTEDFAVAIVDELERPRHRRTRFTVAN